MYLMLQLILMLVLFMFNGVHPAMAVERPFDLTGAGNIEFTTDANGNAIGGRLTASGTATQLGQWTQVGVLSFTPDPSTPIIILTNGESIFTAANRDELQAVINNGQLDTTTGIATGTFLFSGGTGRFDEATGSANFTVTQDLTSGAFKVAANGTIDY